MSDKALLVMDMPENCAVRYPITPDILEATCGYGKKCKWRRLFHKTWIYHIKRPSRQRHSCIFKVKLSRYFCKIRKGIPRNQK